ncbi:MAG: hypothetical protein VYD87_16390 [Pseudomonadota bacterium]|nr:hypothetical protein [Pseudomonadota bacterium]
MQHDRVTQAEAARQLGLNRSTVSRLVAANPALADEGGRVSVEEVRRLRAETSDPRLATKTPDAARPASTMNDHRARAERAKADVAELDLAERLGRTLDRRAVEIAVGDAAETLRQAGVQMARDCAEALSRVEDPREMERELVRFFEAALAAGVTGLLSELGDDAEADAA